MADLIVYPRCSTIIGSSVEKDLRARVKELEAEKKSPTKEPIAWESTTPGYIKYVTQSQYDTFSPATKEWYKPYRCSACESNRLPEGWAIEFIDEPGRQGLSITTPGGGRAFIGKEA